MSTDVSVWIYFNLFIVCILAIDLGLINRKNKKVTFKESILWTILWIILALAFDYGLLVMEGKDKALDFLTGYVIEKSLSIDNIFVIVLIFQYFSIPERLHHRVLFWGIGGALIMRLIFIFLGIELMSHMHWIIYLFGIILIVTGIKMGFQKEQKINPENNHLMIALKKFIPSTPLLAGNKFFIRINGRRFATPLFFCLVMVELSDLIFAIDSIPAILAITTDEFIVYSSNAFAIMGMRSLYFSISGLIKIFKYLHYALAFILLFIGIKMVLTDYFPISTLTSLIVIASSISLSILFSIVIKKINE